jgi:hypothetical protein
MASLGEDLLGIVNKLQDLVFNTIGNDSLDLPQIVRNPSLLPLSVLWLIIPQGGRWFAVLWKVIGSRKHRWSRLSAAWQWHRYSKTAHSPAHQHPHRR